MKRTQIKRWWLLTTENAQVVETDDPYYNTTQLFGTPKPFYGTSDELLEHIQKHWFTRTEVSALKKGWQAYRQIALKTRSGKQMRWRWKGTFKEQKCEHNFAWHYVTRGAWKIGEHGYYHGKPDWYLGDEQMDNAPWIKHKVLVDVKNAKFCMSFNETYTRHDGEWAKTLHITCLDQNGTLNRTVAKSVITKVGKFVAELQSTI